MLQNQSRISGGFTLVELLVVISIISVLSSVGFATHRTLIYRTIQTEASYNLRHVATLYRTYQSEADLRWSESGFGVSATNGSWRYHILTTSFITSNCNYQNPFGFKMQDCPKSRFSYWIRKKNADDSTFNGAASLKVGAFRDFPYNAIELNINLCGQICTQHMIPSVGTASAHVYSACIDSNYPTFEDFMRCTL